MAKNSVDAYGASGKTNVLSFETGALKIVTDPKHPLYDERILLPLDEAMVLNIMALGVREPVLVWKDPEAGEVLVVDGRQRVRHAEEANRRLAARGEPPILVPGVAQRGTVENMSDLMISMNEARQEDPPMTRARKMASFAGRGYSDSRLAIIFACSELTVRNTLALLDSSQAVQNAADAGQITLTHAKALGKLTPDEQREKVAQLVDAGKDAKPHQRSRRQAEIMGAAPKLKSRTQIQKALEQAHGDYAAALRWVLGVEPQQEPTA